MTPSSRTGSEHASEESVVAAPRSIAANTMSQLGPLVVSYGISFIQVPIVVAGLGLSQFGLWSVTGALAQYGALLDLGVSRAVSRYVALYEAESNRKAQGEILTIALLALLAVGAVLSCLAAVGAHVLASALGQFQSGEVRWVLLCGVWMLTLLLCARVIGAYSTGRQRMDTPNRALVVNALLTFVASVGSVAVSSQLTVFASANVVATGIGTVVMVAMVWRAEGGIPLSRPTRDRAREIYGFGLKSQVVLICDLIVFESDKILVGIFVSPAAAGAYEIGSRLAMAARNVSIMSLSALLAPLTVDISKRGDKAVQERYYHLSNRSVTVGFPPLVLGAAAAGVFLTFWLDDVPRYTELVAVVLCLSTIANVATGVASTVASAAGRPGITAKSSVITAVLNLLLSGSLGVVFGVSGILTATAVATIVGAWVGLHLVHRWFDLSLGRFLRAVGQPLALAVLAAVPAVVAGAFHVSGRLEGGILLALSVGVFGAMYVALTAFTGALPPSVPLPAALRRRIAPSS